MRFALITVAALAGYMPQPITVEAAFRDPLSTLDTTFSELPIHPPRLPVPTSTEASTCPQSALDQLTNVPTLPPDLATAWSSFSSSVGYTICQPQISTGCGDDFPCGITDVLPSSQLAELSSFASDVEAWYSSAVAIAPGSCVDGPLSSGPGNNQTIGSQVVVAEGLWSCVGTRTDDGLISTSSGPGSTSTASTTGGAVGGAGSSTTAAAGSAAAGPTATSSRPSATGTGVGSTGGAPGTDVGRLWMVTPFAAAAWILCAW